MEERTERGGDGWRDRRSVNKSTTPTTGIATCLPRLRKGSRRSTVPMSTLLDRLREVFLRLVVLSARGTGTTTSRNLQRPGDVGGESGTPRVDGLDACRSEAVADCIEFFKKSVQVDREINKCSSSTSSGETSGSTAV